MQINDSREYSISNNQLVFLQCPWSNVFVSHVPEDLFCRRLSLSWWTMSKLFIFL